MDMWAELDSVKWAYMGNLSYFWTLDLKYT